MFQQIPETGVLRCPLCRELAVIPADGVSSFPSSFLINQLLDLMQKQRRDVVPNCSVHQQEQLLYCELCDLVFCFLCDNPLTLVGLFSIYFSSFNLQLKIFLQQ